MLGLSPVGSTSATAHGPFLKARPTSGARLGKPGEEEEPAAAARREPRRGRLTRFSLPCPTDESGLLRPCKALWDIFCRGLMTPHVEQAPSGSVNLAARSEDRPG